MKPNQLEGWCPESPASEKIKTKHCLIALTANEEICNIQRSYNFSPSDRATMPAWLPSADLFCCPMVLLVNIFSTEIKREFGNGKSRQCNCVSAEVAVNTDSKQSTMMTGINATALFYALGLIAHTMDLKWT